MKFRKIGSDYVIKLDKGEDLIKQLNKFCEEEDIKGAYFTAIGAISNVKLGWFNPVTKVYESKDFNEYFEISSLNGNVGILSNGQVLIHAHGIFSDKNYTVKAGHVFECKISLAAEIFLKDLGHKLDKVPDDEFKLNFLSL